MAYKNDDFQETLRKIKTKRIKRQTTKKQKRIKKEKLNNKRYFELEKEIVLEIKNPEALPLFQEFAIYDFSKKRKKKELIEKIKELTKALSMYEQKPMVLIKKRVKIDKNGNLKEVKKNKKKSIKVIYAE